MSPTPSPASSGGSQPGSNNSGSQSNSVTIPQMIHHIASSYVNITSYILYAYDIWEQADLLAKKNKGMILSWILIYVYRGQHLYGYIVTSVYYTVILL